MTTSDDSIAPVARIWHGARVVPVLTIDDWHAAVPLARALLAGGIHVLEVTLRTRTALDSIRAIVDALPEAIVGAGTVTAAREIATVAAAGARFVVSPGLSDRVVRGAEETGLPCLPGIVTPSDAIRALDLGLTEVKLFPAGVFGGMALLRALSAPFPTLRFCPTGGIDAANAAGYLAHPAVFAVGGSWLAPQGAVAAADWDRVRRSAAEAAAM